MNKSQETSNENNKRPQKIPTLFFEEYPESEYLCPFCGKLHAPKEWYCDEAEKALNKCKEKYFTGYIWGNIYFLCQEKQMDFHSFLNKAFYLYRNIIKHNFYKCTLFESEFLFPFFAAQLNCNLKDLFNPQLFYNQIIDNLRFISVQDTFYDENGKIEEIRYDCHLDKPFGNSNYYNAEIDVRKSNGQSWSYLLQLDIDRGYGLLHTYSITAYYDFSHSLGNLYLILETEGRLQELVDQKTDWHDLAYEVTKQTFNPSKWYNKLLSLTTYHQIIWNKKERKINENFPDNIVTYSCIHNRIIIDIVKNNTQNTVTIYLQKNRDDITYLYLSSNCPEDIIYIDNFNSLIKVIETEIESSKLREKDLNIPQIEVPLGTAIVMRSSIGCLQKGHEIKTYRGLVPILTSDNTIIQYEIYLGQCMMCKKYIMFEQDYTEMSKVGKILCNILTESQYQQQFKNGWLNYKGKSVLSCLGYQVQSKNALTVEKRHEIIDQAITLDLMTPHQIIDFLNWLIISRQSIAKYEHSIKKWREDMLYVESKYSDESTKIKIDTIHLRE